MRFAIALAQSLGVLGVFGLAVFDSFFVLFGANDIVLIAFVASKASWEWAVAAAVMATCGSVLGTRIMYRLGKRSGAEILRKRIPERARERVLGWTRRYGALPVGVAAIMPPPCPFAPFVVAAGVIEVPRARFSLSVALGRGVRYGVEAYFAMLIGRKLLHHLDAVYWKGLEVAAIGVAVLLAAWLLYRFWHARRRIFGLRSEPAREKGAEGGKPEESQEQQASGGR